MRLPSLPNEIIDHILGFVPQSDLAKLCQVNKSLRHSAEPFLYSTIFLYWYHHEIPPIIPLLRTLLERPELFVYIDSVTLCGTDFGAGVTRPLLDTTTMPLDQFQAAIKQTQVPYTSLWIDQLRSGSMDALAGLLIANLSKTVFLAITHNFIDECEIVPRVLQSKILGQLPEFTHFGRLPKFEQLSHLVYCKQKDDPFEEYNDDGYFIEAISLLCLPTVTDLVIRLPNTEVFYWPFGEPNLDHLTSLEVDWVYPRCLAKILTCTRNLRTLTWIWQYQEDATIGSDSILDYDRIVTALSPLKGTLETLCFRLDEEVLQAAGPGIATVGSWNGLRDFQRLTHLDVPLMSLTGVGPDPQPMERYIPDRLETLCLSPTMLTQKDAVLWMSYPEAVSNQEFKNMSMDESTPEHYITAVIHAFTRQCSSSLPRLHCICFVGDYYLWDIEIDFLMDQLGVKHGSIEFHVIDEQYWEARHLPGYLDYIVESE
ncbi:unnamed protein product [Clonostachys byssicola]|uniref:F-box domain-containing protein n=1 Tax=Clonostachys byssicola TaxID=160290 RepID=A0A9N9XV73_9HYPO|nr:unnamed protein product [Clonostachys byssicola]